MAQKDRKGGREKKWDAPQSRRRAGGGRPSLPPNRVDLISPRCVGAGIQGGKGQGTGGGEERRRKGRGGRRRGGGKGRAREGGVTWSELSINEDDKHPVHAK